MTRGRHLLVGALLLALGFVVGTGIPSESQDWRVMSKQPADISQLDYLLLRARVTVLEQTIADELALPLSPLGFSYEGDKNRVVGRVFVSPSWLAQTSEPKAKNAYSRLVPRLCLVGIVGSGILMEPKNCTIEFFTLSRNSAGALGPRDVAYFENGQLVLK